MCFLLTCGPPPEVPGVLCAPSDFVRRAASAAGCGTGVPILVSLYILHAGPWCLLLRRFPWDCQLTPASLLLPCFLWGGPWVAAEELGLPLWVCVGDWRIQSSLRYAETCRVDAFGIGWMSLDFPVVLTVAVRVLRARSFPCSRA